MDFFQTGTTFIYAISAFTLIMLGLVICVTIPIFSLDYLIRARSKRPEDDGRKQQSKKRLLGIVRLMAIAIPLAGLPAVAVYYFKDSFGGSLVYAILGLYVVSYCSRTIRRLRRYNAKLAPPTKEQNPNVDTPVSKEGGGVRPGG